jgi:hypothetical protein
MNGSSIKHGLMKNLQFLDQRKRPKKQWLQVQNKRNIHNVSNVRQEASRQFGNKTTEYVKSKINECETNGKYRNIRDMHSG